MNLYTLQQLSTMMDALTARVNTLDGQNLTYNTKGLVPQNVTQINSIITDLGQLAASFENQLTQIKTQLATMQALLNTITGA